MEGWVGSRAPSAAHPALMGVRGVMTLWHIIRELEWRRLNNARACTSWNGACDPAARVGLEEGLRKGCSCVLRPAASAVHVLYYIFANCFVAKQPVHVDVPPPACAAEAPASLGLQGERAEGEGVFSGACSLSRKKLKATGGCLELSVYRCCNVPHSPRGS